MPTINEYLMDKHGLGQRIVARIQCADGFSISVQAGECMYCTPRQNEGPWTHVECGYPSSHPGEDLMEYVEDPDNPLGTVYGYVPVEVVETLIATHGGMQI